MGNKRYSSDDLEVILDEFRSGTPLSDLANKLDRSPYGLALKIVEVSESRPSVWDLAEVRSYTHAEIRKHRGDVAGQKRRWGLKRKERRSLSHRETPEIDISKFQEYLSGAARGYPSRKEYARKLEVHPSLLSHYLSGRRTPSESFLKRVASVQQTKYEVLVSYLSPEPRV